MSGAGAPRRARSWHDQCPRCRARDALRIKLDPTLARPMLICTKGCSPVQLAIAAELMLLLSGATRHAG